MTPPEKPETAIERETRLQAMLDAGHERAYVATLIYGAASRAAAHALTVLKETRRDLDPGSDLYVYGSASTYLPDGRSVEVRVELVPHAAVQPPAEPEPHG